MTATVTNVVTENLLTGATDVAATLGPAVVIALIVLLIAKEIAGASENPKAEAFGRHLVVGIVPLLMVFSLIVVVKCAEVLS